MTYIYKMLGVIREAKRVIQIKQVAYCPNLYKAIIIHKTHSTEFDESDDLELMKEKKDFKKKIKPT
jgi:hypothetical protein